MNIKIPLCKTHELERAKGLEIKLEGEALSLFLVRDGETILAYINRCPHTGVELNWLPDQFLDLDGSLIQCATHDARFRLEDGVCIAGPCVGQALQPLAIAVEDEQIYLLDGGKNC